MLHVTYTLLVPVIMWVENINISAKYVIYSLTRIFFLMLNNIAMHVSEDYIKQHSSYHINTTSLH